MRGLPGPAFRLTPDAVAAALGATRWGDPHHSQPAVVSLTCPSDHGTSYTPAEVRAIADVAGDRSLHVHMDGARIANTVAALGCTPAELTWRAGVDVLTLGATKNGALSTDAIVCFDAVAAAELVYRTKRAGHAASNMRYQSAQLDTYLTDGLWLRLAATANRAMAVLIAGLRDLEVELLNEPDVNMLFLRLPADAARRLERAEVRFYDMGGGVVRFVTSFQTTEADAREAVRRVSPSRSSDDRRDVARRRRPPARRRRGDPAGVVPAGGRRARRRCRPRRRRRRRPGPAAGVPGERPRPSRRRRCTGPARWCTGPAPAGDGPGRHRAPALRSTVRGADRPDGARADGGLRRHRQPGVPARAHRPRAVGRRSRGCGAHRRRTAQGRAGGPWLPDVSFDAREDGRVLGAILLSEMPPSMTYPGGPWITEIFVDPDATGRGHRGRAAGAGGARRRRHRPPDARPRRDGRQPGPSALRGVRVRRPSRTSVRSCSRR